MDQGTLVVDRSDFVVDIEDVGNKCRAVLILVAVTN